ncbi:cysteine--tRNA ligase [Sandaracinobacter neustonicus]|uniref:Cysteine--tRNA ligase n=1 Tax=Sandaracinobacter neustonicus TaxID=1715348 RepID=A0A501XVY0_9SPHN|nr:cysteine--tRNA ligase [Sandaracinobacter neustonicus]TPE64483.1 cysteine--tRNA ligase [Sandaracinobacter neustonicus]
MQLQLYDTLSRAKKPVRTPEPGKPITLYVCGPTVYGRAHIGNARPAVVFDTLYRLLRQLHGPENVRYARNITDIDDKIMAKAVAENRTPQAVAAEFEAHYFADMAALGCLKPDFNPRATEHIAGEFGMIAMIEALVARGHAYEANGHVLFEIAKFPGYGELSKRPMDEMIAGARVEVAPYKRAPGDFVLWKPSSEDQPGWESPWGRGRPGWHIECSAMIRSVLETDTIDIHGGGLDLQFPHHENERAQSCCAHGGAELARIWMHNGFLTMGETKMSKSLGNIITPGELLEAGWPGEVLRLALLSAHYRQPLQWTDALLEQSRAKLDRLYRRKADGETGAADASALLDDLNTPEALAVFPDGAGLLGFGKADPATWFAGGADAAAIETDLARYREARAGKDWAAADSIRDALKAQGIEISVAKDGTTSWRKA